MNNYAAQLPQLVSLMRHIKRYGQVPRKRPSTQALKPNEIRAEIIRKGYSLTKFAAKANCTGPELSMCISGARIYPQVRRVIARFLKKSVDEVFEDHPQPKRTSWCKAA